MGRGKIEIKKIENVNSRQVTFSKRRSGLLKKAKELAVLCDAQVGVIIFSGTGKLYEFASSCMEQILARYNKNRGSEELVASEHPAKQDEVSIEMDVLKMEIEKLQSMQRHMMGKGLEGLSFIELQNLEQQLAEGIISVKDKKEKVLLEQLEKSRLQEKKVAQQNEELLEKIEELRSHARLSNENRLSFMYPIENEGNSDDTSLRLGFSSDPCCKKKILKVESDNDHKNNMIVG